jgi:Protein of unknown function (DUF2946)
VDDIVLRGMAKWPNVPAVYGWLSLTRRGQWLIKGNPVRHAAIAEFIARNYEHDEQGRWFFQNGPQRVFVDLEYTPLVYRAIVSTEVKLETHIGRTPESLSGAWLDENGNLVIETECGVGVVHDQDLENFMEAFVDIGGNGVPEAALEIAFERMQQGHDSQLCLQYQRSVVAIEPLKSGEAASRFRFDPSPTAPSGHPECA